MAGVPPPGRPQRLLRAAGVPTGRPALAELAEGGALRAVLQLAASQSLSPGADRAKGCRGATFRASRQPNRRTHSNNATAAAAAALSDSIRPGIGIVTRSVAA